MPTLIELLKRSENRNFIVCDFSPPNGGNSELLSESSVLTPDMFSVAYSPGKSVRVNPVMVSHWLQNNCKIPSIFTLATRDMNKGALQGILLGAQLLGLDNVV